MNLDTLQKEMVSAMKAKDKQRKETISSLISAVKKAAIDEKCRDNISEELVNKVILKEKKTVQEMIDACPSDRTETLENYRMRMAVIEEFAPKMMSEEEVSTEVAQIIQKLKDDSVSINKGIVMKNVMSILKGKADGKMINAIVGKYL